MNIQTATIRTLCTATILLLFGTAFFTRCANMSGTPQGGPKDTLPPVVVRIVPANGSVNIKPRRVSIDFNEYVQLKDLQKEFFTSPFMNVKPTVSVRGRGIAADIKADLDSSTTYVLNFGSSVVDNNEGNPLIGLKYVFSTGAYIDSLYMSGFVSDAKTTDTVANSYLFFYDEKADSIPDYDSVIFNSNALAVTRTTPNGIFIHSNLKPMNYRVYAMLDNNSNQMYDPGADDVAFMDTTYNPSLMEPFHIWYDTTLMYYVAEPQIYMRTFREIPRKRQNLILYSRPEAQKLIMKFGAPDPEIETFEITGIAPENIVIEQTVASKDSTIYWLKVPKADLPDTLVANITYMRSDSVGVLRSHSQQLNFIWKRPAPTAQEKREADIIKKESRAAAKAEKRRKKRNRRRGIPDTVPVDTIAVAAIDTLAAVAPTKEQAGEQADTTARRSEMKYKFVVPNPMSPKDDVRFTLDLLAEEFDTKQVVMTNTDTRKRVVNVPFTIARDTMKLREYIIQAQFKEGENYDLMIPAGVIKTIDGEVNDTIRTVVSISESSKFASLVINLVNTNPDYEYVIEILNETGKNTYITLAHLREGKHSISYVPTGKIVIRLLEDRNHNGLWDTGNLIKRIQPEKVETYINPITGDRVIATKANWELEFDIDVGKLFMEKVFHSAFEDEHEHETENPAGQEQPESVEPTENQNITTDESI